MSDVRCPLSAKQRRSCEILLILNYPTNPNSDESNAEAIHHSPFNIYNSLKVFVQKLIPASQSPYKHGHRH